MKCSAIARSGERCRAIAITGSDYCHGHHPDRADVRRSAARKGGKKAGRGRPMTELTDLKAQLADLYTSVITDMVNPKTGAVLAQITNAQIRCTEVELKVREQQELEVRLQELEVLLEDKDQVSGWR